jgi:hypothetical protein
MRLVLVIALLAACGGASSSRGTSFGHEHWRIREGGWLDSTVWCAGAFDLN